MKITVETKKQQLLSGLSGARQEVLAAAMNLPRTEQDTPFLGTWSAHDVVAHLVGWDHANREAVEAIRGGRLPAFYARYDRDWRTFNAELVARHKQATLEETVALAQASHAELLATLDAVPAAELIRDYGVRSPGNRRVTIPMLLDVEARDERKHAEQIREFCRGKS
jgi:hypothetical protein